MASNDQAKTISAKPAKIQVRLTNWAKLSTLSLAPWIVMSNLTSCAMLLNRNDTRVSVADSAKRVVLSTMFTVLPFCCVCGACPPLRMQGGAALSCLEV